VTVSDDVVVAVVVGFSKRDGEFWNNVESTTGEGGKDTPGEPVQVV